MQKRIIRSLIILLALVCTAFGSRLLANTSLRPLRKSELLALVAAGVLPETPPMRSARRAKLRS